MDSATFTALVAIVFTLLGAFLTSISGYYGLKRQDERRFKHEEEKKRKLDYERKVTLYRHLKDITDKILSRSKVGETVRQLTGGEYETIASIIAQDHVILDQSTVAAWDTKQVTKTDTSGSQVVWYWVQCEVFWEDVKKHYDAFKYSAVPPTS